METKDVINKKPVEKKEETNPQILEMQQTMQELSSRLDKATNLISEKDKEIEEMRSANAKAASDKLAKEKDLKDAFGIKKSETPKRSTEDINSLTNAEMFEVIAEVVEGAIDANREEASLVIDENFKGLESKFDQVVGHIMKKEADVELKTIRSKNPDFDNYKDEVREVLKKHQEFSIEDAYDWIKMKEAKGEIASKHIVSEKPDKDLSAADEAVVRNKRQPEGRKVSRKRQFASKLEEAITRVQSRRGGQ